MAGLRAGAPWDVTFLAFSLGQVHVARGRAGHLGASRTTTRASWRCRPASWSATSTRTRFLDAHEALFALRHDKAGHLRDEGEVRTTLE